MGGRRYYKKKKRKAIYKRILTALLFVGVCVAIYSVVVHKGFPVYTVMDKNTNEDFPVNNIINKNMNQEIFMKLKNMARSNDKVLEVLKNSEKYPEEILELLSKNEETVNFVLDYPEKQNTEPKKSIGKVRKGEIPELLQWDERWGYAKYGDSILAICGCGPTALSMVSASLTEDNRITPYKVAKYADDNGYYVEGTGSSWSLMTEGSRHFGVQGKEMVLDKNIIFSELENGHPIICSMRPGDFTTSGHFIVLTGVKDGKIQVNDPNSIKRSTLWDYDRLEHQINNLWVFTKA